MCGICGYLSKTKIDDSSLDRMTDILMHRGPDDRGVVSHSFGDYHIGLGHRRLSILDLSEAGHQPMTDYSGRYTIVFNGEIYNYMDLYDEVKDYPIRSSSDTEVLLYLYVKYGVNCLDLLNGMFAFAIYDHAENRLFMARDRMGEKPLYYYSYYGHFAFASELKSIATYPYFVKSIDRGVLLQFLSSNYIHPPHTIYENTYKLGAGEYLIWNNGEYHIEKYYDPIESYYDAIDLTEESYDVCKSTLKELIYDSVNKRLIADVPIGTFLSGGIDSTLISAIACDIKGDKGLETFSIGFEDPQYDESNYALESAEYLGTQHHQEIMRESDLLRMLEDLTYYYDEPFADSSQLPTMLVAEFARRYVTTALSGDGGDELFAGYTYINTLDKLMHLDPVLSPIRSLIPDRVSKSMIRDWERVLFERKEGPEKTQYYTKTKENMARLIVLGINGRDESAIIDDERINRIDNWMQRRMLTDMVSYLPDEIMTKTDRASMRVSLEMRSPLLDHRIVDYSMRIPLKYKYCNGDKKHILKDILYDYIPKEMMDRPKKGFSAPVYRWLNSTLAKQLEYYTDREYLRRQGLFNQYGINNIMKRFKKSDEKSVTQVVWNLLIFQMWDEQNV